MDAEARIGLEAQRRTGGSALEATTLRRRILSLLVRSIVLFLGVVSLVVYFSYSQLRRDALENDLLLARTVAESVDAMISSAFIGLGRLPSQLPELDDSALSRLRSFRFQSLFRDAVFVLDEDGRRLVADPEFAQPPFSGAQPAHREMVTSLLGRSDAEGRPVLAMVQPFRREGRDYFLVSEMNPRGSAISQFLQSLVPEPDLHIVVVDGHGTIIAAADQKHLFETVTPAELLGDRIASHRSYVAESVECSFCDDPGVPGGFLLVMAPLRFAPWGVVVQQPHRAAFATLYVSQASLLTVVVLLVLTGILLSRALSRSVVAPLQELSEQAERLRHGDLSQPISVRGDREVRLLAASLDEAREKLASTLAELRSLNESLEEEVASRTQVLREQDSQRRTLVRRLLSAGEEERRRIARELHDEISQLLAVIQLSLDSVALDSPEMRKARELLATTQAEVHRIIYDLRPSILDDLGLSTALQWYADNYLAPQGLQVHVEVEEGLSLPDEIEIAAFRIYQEIITNILRHSRAESVSIELYTTPERLVLAVEDDGVGFTPEQKTDGVGIVGMRERARLVGGDIYFDSEPGFGTHVRLEIPTPRDNTNRPSEPGP